MPRKGASDFLLFFSFTLSAIFSYLFLKSFSAMINLPPMPTMVSFYAAWALLTGYLWYKGSERYAKISSLAPSFMIFGIESVYQELLSPAAILALSLGLGFLAFYLLRPKSPIIPISLACLLAILSALNAVLHDTLSRQASVWVEVTYGSIYSRFGTDAISYLSAISILGIILFCIPSIWHLRRKLNTWYLLLLPAAAYFICLLLFSWLLADSSLNLLGAWLSSHWTAPKEFVP